MEIACLAVARQHLSALDDGKVDRNLPVLAENGQVNLGTNFQRSKTLLQLVQSSNLVPFNSVMMSPPSRIGSPAIVSSISPSCTSAFSAGLPGLDGFDKKSLRQGDPEQILQNGRYERSLDTYPGTDHPAFGRPASGSLP